MFLILNYSSKKSKIHCLKKIQKQNFKQTTFHLKVLVMLNDIKYQLL